MKIIPSLVRLFTAGINRLMMKRAGNLPAPNLAPAVERARREWEQALQEFNQADGDLIDSMVIKINTAEKRYIALLKQAKENGTCAWFIDA